MDKVNSRYNDNLVTWLLIGTGISFLISLALMQVLTVVIVVLWFTEHLSDKKRAFGRIELFFLIFVIFRLLSIFISEFPGSSYQSLYKDTLFYISLFAFSFYFRVLPVSNVKKIIYSFIYAAVLVSVIGIVLFNLGIKDRAASITSGYATFSTYLLAALALIFINYDASQPNKKRSLWLLLSAIIFTGIITALSRADLGIAILVFIIGSIFVRMKIVDIVLILSIITIFSFLSFTNNTRQISERIEKPATLSDRDIIWGTALEKAREHPVFGYGVRTFKNVFTNFDKLNDKEIGGWHNDYIAVYIESGILGLLSFLALIYQILYSGFKGIKNVKDSLERKPLIFIFLSILSMLLSAAMSGFVTNPILSIVFTFILAIFSSLYTKISVSDQSLVVSS